MARYKLSIEYDGTPFSGWQRQTGQPSVQQSLEEAIESFSGEKVTTQAAGRTDAGVHARAQVAHFDLVRQWDAFRVGEALNFHLKPNPVAIVECRQVGEDFEARFSAKKRHYQYIILNRRARPTLEISRVWHVAVPLDADLMHEAAQCLAGKHDFTTFRAAECQSKSPVKTVDEIGVTRRGEHIFIRVNALSFLHHQVRSFAGSLKIVGEGKWLAGDLKKALEARNRSWCGAMAPAAGLYLTRVEY